MLVLGSDGLFDNLSDFDISVCVSSIVTETLNLGKKLVPKSVAMALVSELVCHTIIVVQTVFFPFKCVLVTLSAVYMSCNQATVSAFQSRL